MNAALAAEKRRLGEDPTRGAAFDLLVAVLEERITLPAALDRLPALASRDRAAAHRLAASVLRRLHSLDVVLEAHLRRAPPRPVQHILRLGAAGLLLLKTPAHAAVSSAVALARARGLAPFAGLINAVLRQVAVSGSAALAELDAPRLETPSWLWRSWGAEARAIASAHLAAESGVPLDITLRPGVLAPPGGKVLPTGARRYPPGTMVTALEGFERGDFWVQDAAAALPVRILAPRAGELIADLCAAPGGKTAQLAASGALVVALEQDSGRAHKLSANLARLRQSVEIIVADAASWRSAERFSAVLLDAPCSATGIVRRHPDIPHLRREQDLAALIGEQDRLLDAAAALLAPGGRLIYTVCSLQPEEGLPRVAAVAARTGLVVEPITPQELADFPEALSPEGFLCTHPGMWAEEGGIDGFFAARLRAL